MNIKTKNIIHRNDRKSNTEETIKVVLQRPGEISEAVLIRDNQQGFLKVLGGVYQSMTVPDIGLTLFFRVFAGSNKANITMGDLTIKGNVFIVKTEGKAHINLTNEQIQSARGWLLRHTFWEDEKT